MHKEENDGGTPAPPASAPGLPTAAAAHGGGRSKPAKRTGSTAVNKGRGPRRRGTLAGLLSAAVIVAAGGGLVAAASLAPQPSGGQELEVPLASVPAGMSQDVCPGPAKLLEGTPVGTDPQFSPESATARSTVSAAVVGAAGALLPGSRLSALDGSELVRIAKDPGTASAPAGASAQLAGVVAQRDVKDVSVLSADALGNRQAAAAGVMSYSATDGDLQGSAAAACQAPLNDLWLTGANTAVGRSSVLHLTNASTTPATVNLELFGKDGQIKAPGSRGLLVGPGTTRSIVLAGLAPGQERLSVHARSTGGPVSAFIQQSALRGLTPGGVDFIAPGTAPSALQVMTGVDIQDAAGLEDLTATRGFSDAAPSLQITVPGPVDAVVEVKLFGRGGQKALPGGGVVTAKAGTVTEVPLAGVPTGQYTVSASADVTIVAAARVTRGLKAAQSTDFSWAPSTGRLGSQHVVPVPGEGERFLVFGALADRATISYTPITADGKVRQSATADIAGGTTTSLKVPDQIEKSSVTGYLVSAAGGAAYGTVLLEREGRNDVSTVAITPGAEGQQKVPVTLGY
ncbi:MAG: hypothetical protein QOH40_1112 [Arthrobacter pascens]|jgi:hypothetical protein|nr:hypothetical protein [Arthrobacter pascens]